MGGSEKSETYLLADEIEKVIGIPKASWRHQCHVVSLAVVRSGLFPGSRVARGTCKGVGSQHSWVVDGGDCYAEDAKIIDPTLWTYDPEVDDIWYGSAADKRHVPHGAGSVWAYGRPAPATGEVVELNKEGLSKDALDYLRMIEPLDLRGWSVVAHSPVGGWPAAEILAAMDDTPRLGVLVPIDVLGMLTDRNPDGLYR